MFLITVEEFCTSGLESHVKGESGGEDRAHLLTSLSTALKGYAGG